MISYLSIASCHEDEDELAEDIEVVGQVVMACNLGDNVLGLTIEVKVLLPKTWQFQKIKAKTTFNNIYLQNSNYFAKLS